jgi:hypothetical protein
MPPRNLAPAQSLTWRDWYSLQSWRRRAKHQLMIAPLCALCEEQGRITAATIADHHPPHKGDYNAFRLGPLRSLCRDCHQGAWAVDNEDIAWPWAMMAFRSIPRIRSTKCDDQQ